MAVRRYFVISELHFGLFLLHLHHSFLRDLRYVFYIVPSRWRDGQPQVRWSPYIKKSSSFCIFVVLLRYPYLNNHIYTQTAMLSLSWIFKLNNNFWFLSGNVIHCAVLRITPLYKLFCNTGILFPLLSALETGSPSSNTTKAGLFNHEHILPDFMSVNGALEVDFFGHVCAEPISIVYPDFREEFMYEARKRMIVIWDEKQLMRRPREGSTQGNDGSLLKRK